jgi:hypothetical protein
MTNDNNENQTPNKSEILRVCIQLYSYYDRTIVEAELSIGELYHEIFVNDGRLDFDCFKRDLEWLNSNNIISLNNKTIVLDERVAKALIEYVFKQKHEK